MHFIQTRNWHHFMLRWCEYLWKWCLLQKKNVVFEVAQSLLPHKSGVCCGPITKQRYSLLIINCVYANFALKSENFRYDRLTKNLSYTKQQLKYIRIKQAISNTYKIYLHCLNHWIRIISILKFNSISIIHIIIIMQIVMTIDIFDWHNEQMSIASKLIFFPSDFIQLMQMNHVFANDTHNHSKMKIDSEIALNIILVVIVAWLVKWTYVISKDASTWWFGFNGFYENS